MVPAEAKMLKKILFIVLGLVIVALTALTVLMGGPKNLYGVVRYGFPQVSRGALRVGDSTPDAQLTALDGRSTFHLRERIGRKPLVLIFGSYT